MATFEDFDDGLDLEYYADADADRFENLDI